MFIKNESNIYLFVIAIIAIIAVPIHAYEPAYWHSSSVLNSGKWVKIRVDSTGMQQITHSKLIEMGFKSPEDVTVWGYSGAMLNDDRFRNDIPRQPSADTGNTLLGKNYIFRRKQHKYQAE